MTSHDDNRGADGGTSAPDDTTKAGIPDFTDRAREIADWFCAHYDVGPVCGKCLSYAESALQDAYALGQAAGAEAMREEAASSAVRNRFDDEHCENVLRNPAVEILLAGQIAAAIRALPLSGVSSGALATTARPSISTEE